MEQIMMSETETETYDAGGPEAAALLLRIRSKSRLTGHVELLTADGVVADAWDVDEEPEIERHERLLDERISGKHGQAAQLRAVAREIA